MFVEGCGTCRANRGEIPAPGGVIHQDALWRLEHIFEPIPIEFRGPRVFDLLREATELGRNLAEPLAAAPAVEAIRHELQ
jgi:hypothetical protein